MFPGYGAQVHYNEDGEPLGWDYPSSEPEERDPYDDEPVHPHAVSDPLFDEEDLQKDSNYCRHGNFIGNPFGGDYLCGPCEMGDD